LITKHSRSSTLIPKPADWGPHINVTGFSFLPQASSYQPAEDLAAFLKAGPPPVYIGFGSIVVDHPEQLTALIYGAVKRAGVRALVSQGWGGLGGDKPPEGVFLLGNVPHDWLFQHVSAVVHHGGAGTTAIGIALGKPTVVVPFFGDQPFWGAMIAKAGAGPEPIPFKKMTEESLAQSIMAALTPEIQAGVKIMAEKIAKENGAAEAVNSFTNSIDMDSMRCLVSPDNVAAWRIKNTDIRLSLVGSATLIDEGYLNMGQLKL
jgi:UDP:flavonoid glycosyltransferase YjiC (YdhE family)